MGATDCRESAVIIGAGQAGGWAARTLRSEGFTGRIVLIGDEPVPPYERPPLSKEQLQQGAPALASLLGAADLAAHDIEWRGDTACLRIDRVGRQVLLADGSSVAYDKLLLCTGGRPRLPAIAGIDAPCVHTLRTVADADRLRQALRGGARVLVIGGGWIGLEVAAAARKAGCAVTLVEAGARLCARTGSAQLSDFLTRLHRERGVEFHFNASVVAVEEGARAGWRAVLADGRALTVDLVVVGIGLIPNDELADAAGLECERGIVVDHQCRTADPAIFAAGDVAALKDHDGTLLRLESWQNAQDQAIWAARAMLGLQVDYRPAPFFWSQQYETMVQIAGTCRPGARIVTREVDSERVLIAELDADGRLLCAISTNSPREFRQLRKFVAAGMRVDAARFKDPTVPLTGISA